jgi:hypothetical protein
VANPLAELMGISDKEFLALVAKDAGAKKGLRDKGKQVTEVWQGHAPVFGDKDPRRAAPEHGEPEDYRNSIAPGEPFVNKEGNLELRVRSDDFKAVWIELGARHMPIYAPATQTMQELGAEDGPIVTSGDQRGVDEAQHHLVGELERLAELRGVGAHADHIARQQGRVDAARQARSAAFKAAKPRRGSRGRKNRG